MYSTEQNALDAAELLVIVSADVRYVACQGGLYSLKPRPTAVQLAGGGCELPTGSASIRFTVSPRLRLIRSMRSQILS